MMLSKVLNFVTVSILLTAASAHAESAGCLANFSDADSKISVQVSLVPGAFTNPDGSIVPQRVMAVVKIDGQEASMTQDQCNAWGTKLHCSANLPNKSRLEINPILEIYPVLNVGQTAVDKVGAVIWNGNSPRAIHLLPQDTTCQKN